MNAEANFPESNTLQVVCGYATPTWQRGFTPVASPYRPETISPLSMEDNRDGALSRQGHEKQFS